LDVGELDEGVGYTGIVECFADESAALEWDVGVEVTWKKS
jgi:hypothetical protein